MRQQTLLILLALAILTGNGGCKQINARKSAEVNDAVIFQHKQLMASLGKFISNLESRDVSLIESSRQELLDISISGLKAIERIEAPDCNSEFLPAARSVFIFYKEAASGSYAQISRYYSMDSISYEQYDSLKVFVEEVEAAQKQADGLFLDAQQAFARECGFKLVRNVE